MHKALLFLRKIPKGKVVSYAELAKVCGTSPRAIGKIMANNPYPVNYPCYKVVGSDGKLVGYSAKGKLKTKLKLLQRSGIKVLNGKIDSSYFHKFK